MAVDTGLGATLTFGTSGFTANITVINGLEVIREYFRTTHLGTTTAHTKSPKSLVDFGDFDFTWQYVPDSEPPYDQAAETITVSFPLQSGESTAANITGSGFMSRWKLPDMDTEENNLMEANGTITPAGAWTFTDAT